MRSISGRRSCDWARAGAGIVQTAATASAAQRANRRIMGRSLRSAGGEIKAPENRHPLRLLAEITGLPLYLSTTPDSLLREVLVRVRGLNPFDDVRGFQLVRERPVKALNSDQRSAFSWDLPPGWDPRAPAEGENLKGGLSGGSARASLHRPATICRPSGPAGMVVRYAG